MTQRGRSLSVLLLVIVGGAGVMSATQTWLRVTLTTGADALDVSGADAVPVLAPLSLTVLALAGVIAICGRLLRYVFAAIALLIAAGLVAVTAPIAYQTPVSAVSGAVTDATGLEGTEVVAQLVAGISATPWPATALALWVLLTVTAVFIAATAHRWRTTGKRFRTDTVHDAGPVDAIESWDDLSRGSDPTGPDR